MGYNLEYRDYFSEIRNVRNHQRVAGQHPCIKNTAVPARAFSEAPQINNIGIRNGILVNVNQTALQQKFFLLLRVGTDHRQNKHYRKNWLHA